MAPFSKLCTGEGAPFFIDGKNSAEWKIDGARTAGGGSQADGYSARRRTRVRPGRLQEAAWPQRYSPDMPKKVIPIPEPDNPDKGRAMAERHTRVICNIGGRRYALDFWSRASEISPVDADVLPLPAPPAAHKQESGQAEAGRAKGGGAGD